MWTAQQVKSHLFESKQLSVSLDRVRHILHDDFNMRYRVLKKVQF